MSKALCFLLCVTLTIGYCYAESETVTTEESEQNLNSSRTARQWDIPRDLRFMGRLFFDQQPSQQPHTRRPAAALLPRSDHLPQRTGGPGAPPVPGSPPPYARVSFVRPPQSPNMRRRVYSGPPGAAPPGVFLRPNGGGPQYLPYKNTRFSLAKEPHLYKGPPLNNHHRAPGHNSNAIPEILGFKPSPTYNGEVIVRRPSAGAPLSAKSDERIEALRRFKQHPIPQDPGHISMYSVHEDNDSDTMTNSFGYQSIGEHAMKQAKQYLNFMSSSEYFLPKVEPDYRKLDQSKQQQQQQQQPHYQQQQKKKSSSSDNAALSSIPVHHYQQQQQQQKQHRNVESSNSLNTAFTVNAPLRVSSSYSQSQPQKSAGQVSSVSAYPSQTIVGSSSFAGGNKDFVVGSDGKKIVHSVASTSFSSSDAAQHHHHPPHYHHHQQQQQRQSQSSPVFSSVLRPKLTERGGSSSSDPERVEFTERDAIHGSYTSNPMDSLSRNGDKQTPSSDRRYVKPASSAAAQQTTLHQHQDVDVADDDADDDDQDDDEELMEAASDVYGRVKVNPNDGSSSSSSNSNANPSTEQKDTEEYCERICSNVQDEDEEVVCGSDGFMYTSEAQMECYASCLHIDVTIQSKGTCNQPL